MKLRTTLSHLATGSLMMLAFVAVDQALDNATVSLALFCAVITIGLFAVLLLFALGPTPRKPSVPAARADYPDFETTAPAQPPTQIHVYQQPAPAAPAPTAWPAPQPPQRPVQAGDFQEPKGPSIFDALPPDVPSYNPRRGQHSQPTPTFDSLFDGPGAALPPLEPEPGRNGPLPWSGSSPWDDMPVEFAGPLHSGPLLERRPPRPGEIDTIRDIYAETQSLNKTIQRVYGAKDAKTHGWVKGALEL